MNEIDASDTADFATVNVGMPYLDAAINEVGRLYPTVYATVRTVQSEVQLSSGKTPIVLKPGMLLYVNYHHMHTSPEYWGSDAHIFNPDRHLGSQEKKGFLITFGYGPRKCVSCGFIII